MKGHQPEDLKKVGFYVTACAGEPFSVGQLAKALGVSFVTARRRLQAYAAQNGLELEPGRARVGVRGPQSTTWLLRPPLAFRAAAPREAPREAAPQPVPPVEVPAVPFTDRPGFTPDENRALDLLALTGTARTTELSKRLQRNPARIDGIMRALIRKLFAMGTPLFKDEDLPSGETLYRALDGAFEPR